MRLPEVTAQTPPPRDSGLARATDIGALTRTGAGVQWQAATRAGRALQRGAALGWAAYQKRRAVDDDIESGEASTRTEETALRLKDAANQFDVTMDMPDPGDRDYLKTLKSFSTDKREELVSSYLKDFDADVGQIVQGFSRPEIRARYEKWSKNRRLILEYELKGLFGAKLQNYQLSKLDDFRIAAGENGNLELADSYADLMDKHELITPTKASQLKRNNKEIVKQAESDQVVGLVWPAVADMPYGEAIETIAQMEGITETDRSRLNVRRGNLERARQIQLAQEQEKERGEVFDDIHNGVATWDSIEAKKSLIETEQESLWQLAQKVAKPGSTILEESDTTVELDVQRRIDLGEAITPIEIYSFVGKGKDGGLSLDKARFYIDRLETKTKDPDSPLNNPVVKRAQKMLDELKADHFWLSDEAKKAGEYTPEEEKENIFTWLRLSNDFSEWAIKNPDATDEQIEQKIERMLAPKREEIKLNWFQRLMWQKGDTQLFGLVLSQEEKLARKKIDSLKDEGVWDTLNEQEKLDARDAFLEGRTVQEVLDALRE